MLRLRSMLGIVWIALLGACVTINVYFPAAAAEKAADRIIDKVWGQDAGKPPPKPTSRLERGPEQVLVALADWLVPSAEAAQANIDISSPTIKAIERSMQQRHAQLAPFYDAGAIGLTGNGEVAIRDARAVSLRDRAKLQGLVAEENRDRNALYREIARANGHPEWEPEIRATFAKRWIAHAKRGWWYRDGGGWKQR